MASHQVQIPYPWTKAEVRQFLNGVSNATLDRYMRNYGLPYVKRGTSRSARVYFDPEEVSEWLEQFHGGGFYGNR
jgi:predicted DNA-binding transcriptional regulator AlpA